MPINLSIAPVEPDPQKITQVSSSPPTASRMICAGVLAQPRRLQAGARRLGVGVGVAGEDLVADEVLDEAQRPPRRGVVGIGDPMRAVRPVHHLIVADDGFADPAQQRCLSRLDHEVKLSLASSDVRWSTSTRPTVAYPVTARATPDRVTRPGCIVPAPREPQRPPLVTARSITEPAVARRESPCASQCAPRDSNPEPMD